MLGRVPAGCDINPLSAVLTAPRLRAPSLEEVAARLGEVNYKDYDEYPEDLLVFYHPETLREIASLKKYFLARQAGQVMDAVDEWIRLVAINRLTGHSPGFFSVYTMPPNQAVSVKSQRKINERRKQTPPRRSVPSIILKKSKALLSDTDERLRERLRKLAQKAIFVTGEAGHTPEIRSRSVKLVVTSPPFLDVVDYAGDNWLRCWFLGVDPGSVKLMMPKKLLEWQKAMTDVFREVAPSAQTRRSRGI